MEQYINGVIYLIKNKINNKVYVGQTIQNPKVRFRDHFRTDRKDTILLSNAGLKYGKESFELIILEENIKTRALLDKKEIHYIRKYNSLHPNGYNIHIGGVHTGMLPKMSTKQQEQAVIMYAAGMSMKEIGKVFGRDKKAIKFVLNRYGIESRPTKTKYLTITKDDLLLLINKGLSLKEIAKHYNVVASNISYYIKKYNLKEFYENRRKTANTEM